MRLYVEERENPLGKSRAGLVPVRVMVTRDGQTFEQTVWKRPQEADSSPRGRGAAADRVQGPALVVSDEHALDQVPDLTRELGHAQVARAAQQITDRHVLEHLLHDDLFALIGDRQHGRLVKAETVQLGEHDVGLFPGDGEHHPGRVHVRRYLYPHGLVTIKRNRNALKIHVHRGSLERPGEMREMVKFKIRDRRFDGSKAANESPLTDWFYDGEMDRPHPHAVELSLYSRDPARYHGDVTGDANLGEFLAEPFGLAGSPAFLPAWRRAFALAADPKAPVFPGQVAPSIPGVAQHFTLGIEALLHRLGYRQIDNLPSHFNVYHFLAKQGYQATHPEDERALADLRTALDHLNATRAARGEPAITRAQEAWVVLLQGPAFRGPGVPPPELDLGGKTYPLWMNDDGTARNVWMTKAITERTRT